MSTTPRRVALLARPGVACDRLRGALADAGAELVLEADPMTLDPATLDAAQAQVVLVALDPQTEGTLERFDVALQNPAIEVIFEEAELAAHREGWEAARWVRHLAAKLHRHADVLPPGSASAPANVGNDRLQASEPVLDSRFEAGTPSAVTPEGSADLDPATGPTHAFDPLFGELAIGDGAQPLRPDWGDELPAVEASAAFDPSVNFSYDGDYDSAAAESATDAIAASEFAGFIGGLGDELAADALSLDLPDGESRSASHDPGFDAMFGGEFADPAIPVPHPADSTALDGGDAGTPAGRSQRRELELVSADADHSLRGPAEADGAETDHRFKHDLASLESRIAGMELVNDRIVKGPAQANGAVLVMAGIGGPDAVRQLLGALPEGFPRPILVQQRLDGGHYDKLVAQMQRATTMLVKLAEPGLPAIAGVIYILPAGVCIKVTEAGIQFTDGDDDVLAALPSADSAVVLLSGSDPAQVDAVMSHSWGGALVIGQAPEGCYDAAAPSALLSRGGGSGQPVQLAERLADHWRS